MFIKAVTIGLLSVISFLFGIAALAGMYSMRDPTYSCLVDVVAAAGTSVDPSRPIVGTITYFPLGLSCSFTANDSEMVIKQTNSFANGMAGVSISSLLAVCVIAIAFRR